MAMPEALKNKYLARFDELISDGIKVVEEINRKQRPDGLEGIEWGTKCASLLDQVLPADHPFRNRIPEFGLSTGSEFNPLYQLNQLKGLRDDFVNGFLDKLSEQIEAEIASDYMGQAERLLAEGQTGSFDHVPAAVLAGAVLEKALRTLCERVSPQIPTIASKGRPLTFDPLIDALKKASIIKHTEAAQLKAWATIRNKAAHGEFDKFNREEVAPMISGIRDFLGRHL